MDLQPILDRHAAFWTQAPGAMPLIGRPQRESVFPLRNLQGRLAEGRLEPDAFDPEDFLPSEPGDAPVAEGDGLLNAHWAAPALPWTEAIAGCQVSVLWESGTTWAEPVLSDTEPLAGYRPTIDRTWLAKLVACTEALVAHAAGRYLVSTTLMRGPMDMLGAMLGTARLCQAFIDEPAQVARLLRFCTDAWIEAAEAQFVVIPTVAGGYVNRYRIWAPGRSVVFQADISSLISRRTYERFMAPCDTRLCAAFDYVTMHTHSAGQTQLDHWLAESGPDCIEISVDHLGPTFVEQIPLYRRILERKPLVLMNPNREEVDMALRELPAAGLALIPRWKSNLQ